MNHPSYWYLKYIIIAILCHTATDEKSTSSAKQKIFKNQYFSSAKSYGDLFNFVYSASTRK